MNTYVDATESKRWMLVDDNEDVLLVLSALIENLTGAKIECHNSPQSALAAFIAAPGDYELVITDFEMPGMNGMELCRWMQEAKPEQKVFLATGSGFFTESEARFSGFSALLSKPFPLAALEAALAEAGLKEELACLA